MQCRNRARREILARFVNLLTKPSAVLELIELVQMKCRCFLLSLVSISSRLSMS